MQLLLRVRSWVRNRYVWIESWSKDKISVTIKGVNTGISLMKGFVYFFNLRPWLYRI